MSRPLVPPPLRRAPASRASRAAVALLLVSAPGPLAAQAVDLVPPSLLEEVMPGAARFGRAQGYPPVRPAYGPGPEGEALLGWVFLTSDVPPEPFGYSGPIEALVGMDTTGTLSGVRVIEYYESYRGQMGDFLRTPGFQEQFGGKHITDGFHVGDDVDGISRVSISVRALSRGVRDAARKVAAAHGAGPSLPTAAVLDPGALSWFEMRQAGFVERMEVTDPGEGSVGISLVYVDSDRLGARLLGDELYARALEAVERRGGADHVVLYTLDGARLRLFVREGWAWAQGADTVEIAPADVVSLGLPSGGLVQAEATLVGLMLLRGPLDIGRPFTVRYDPGAGLGVRTVAYHTSEARLRAAEEATRAVASARTLAGARADGTARPAQAEGVVAGNAADPAVTAPGTAGVGTAPGTAGAATTPGIGGAATAPGTAGAAATPGTGGAAPTPEADRAAASAPTGATGPEGAGEGPRRGAAPPPGRAADEATPSAAQPPDAAFGAVRDETLLGRTLAAASWGRVTLLVVVLGLAVGAFAAKRARRLRWASLAATLVLLGFVDGGFLSVSHLTSGLWVGPEVYFSDLSLLLLVGFTTVTTLAWGRVFCGFLCPFGALQDVLERVVPRRLRRPLPARVHRGALHAKYVVLALILVPAAAGSHVSLYQYFEPFGTVFFLSRDVLLWAIAGAFLLASAIVPRFYCRYACPLGAFLALVSFVAPGRIRRVEQCGVCKVCEQACPTGAIRGPRIDFHECVRCNACEALLLDRRGACRHDMEDIRPRLVQLRVGRALEQGAERA